MICFDNNSQISAPIKATGLAKDQNDIYKALINVKRQTSFCCSSNEFCGKATVARLMPVTTLSDILSQIWKFLNYTFLAPT
jgi:hypothetical protein